MTREAIVFEASREGYGIEQIKNPITVGELIDMLSDYDEDTLFILSHDRGYTYGSLSRWDGSLVCEKEGEYGTEWIDADECY